MTQLQVGSDLTYNVQSQTVFQFQIAVATTEHQIVHNESTVLEPNVQMEINTVGLEGNRIYRVVLQPGEYHLSYRADVELRPEVDPVGQIGETPIAQMPVEVLPYLNPSRYCESDLLARFAYEEFGNLTPGHTRVRAICDWVYNQLDYTPGSTNGTTTAADVLLSRTGVCRDYAHLSITLCRALGIPARYLAGYAVDLQPPDFHGFIEAYLDGQWYLFDPTRLAPIQGLVRIGVGRDAADVAFSTLYGSARLINKDVWAKLPDGSMPNKSNQAVSTA